MRVLFVVGKSSGGIGTHVADLRHGLAALGASSAIVTDPATARTFDFQDALTSWPTKAPQAVWKALVGLRRTARGADVVHAHGLQAGALAATALTGSQLPLVVSLHNQPPASPRAQRSAALMLRQIGARAVLVTGASSDLVDLASTHGARWAELAPVPSPRTPGLLALPRLSSAERRAAAARLLGHDPHAPLVVSIARIAAQKDLSSLVAAAALGQRPAIWAVVGGGDEPLREALLQQIAETGAPVRLVGPSTSPEAWLRAAEAFVLTSRWEARALVVQEAMAAGVPVVASAVGGIPDLLHEVGALVPVGDPAAFAAEVDRLLADPEAAAARSAAGREVAASWRDGPATARHWLELYARVTCMT